MEAIINILLFILSWRVLVAFLAGVLIGYGWHASCQMDRDMKQAQKDQEKTPGITAHVEAYKIQEQARYSAYVELGQVPAVPPDETNYLRMSEEDKEMMERIRQRILDKVFPRAETEDDKIARRLLDSLNSDEPTGGDA